MPQRWELLVINSKCDWISRQAKNMGKTTSNKTVGLLFLIRKRQRKLILCTVSYEGHNIWIKCHCKWPHVRSFISETNSGLLSTNWFVSNSRRICREYSKLLADILSIYISSFCHWYQILDRHKTCCQDLPHCHAKYTHIFRDLVVHY